MSSEIIKSQLILWDGYNLTTRVNSFVLERSIDALDDTTLGCTTRSNAPGLKASTMQIEGIYDTTTYDEVLASTIGGSNKLISIIRGSSEGSLAYFMNAVHANYDPIKGAVGELAGFSAGGISRTYPLCRGTVLFNQTGLTTSVAGDAQNLGVVMPTQKLYAGLHVLAIDDNGGDTLDVELESDILDDFTGAETTRITFDQMTDIGSQFKSVSGPIIDVWYRANCTISGATPSFAAVVLMAIRS